MLEISHQLKLGQIIIYKWSAIITLQAGFVRLSLT